MLNYFVDVLTYNIIFQHVNKIIKPSLKTFKNVLLYEAKIILKIYKVL